MSKYEAVHSVGNLEQAGYNMNRYRQLLLDIYLC